MAGERVAVAAQPLTRRVDLFTVAEKADPPVPGGDQMVDGVARRAGVVDQDRVGVAHAAGELRLDGPLVADDARNGA